jgi:4-amino-4-deoxy-L-arabinose transferase-like glycosyltransferase
LDADCELPLSWRKRFRGTIAFGDCGRGDSDSAFLPGVDVWETNRLAGGQQSFLPFVCKPLSTRRPPVADMWLVFFVTAAYWAAYELIADLLGSTTTINESHRKYWRLTFYVALGLAFLAKGPLGWMPLVTVVSMKLILRGKPFNRRFWFLSGLLLTIAIVLSWGFPALLRTDGEFLRIGIGRHVVERSFGALEGHGGQSWHSYLLTLPFYFVTVFISFFPWSIKLPL